MHTTIWLDQGGQLTSQHIVDTVARLSTRGANRTEADIQSDIQTLLTSGELNLTPDQVARLEVQTADGTRRRLDIQIGHCVIEVKKDLRSPGVRRDTEEQLAGYVKQQTKDHGRRYVGIATDGCEWVLYDLQDEALVAIAALSVTGADADRLIAWLEGILATESAVVPTPEEIEARLGASSPGHLLDHAKLAQLYAAGKSKPEVELKRSLWSKLLRTAFGSAFEDDDDSFIDHTLLVLTAEVIAHAVIGINVSTTGDVDPDDLITGRRFSAAQIHGVVEADFFDWVLNVPGGESFVRTLADRISRFDWTHVEHDVLKHLYESVISQEARTRLGEYYTPDWLADRIVNATVTDPLNQRVLDPACGSGTFVFHAARKYIKAAEQAKKSPASVIAGLVDHVIGMDIHPVAVTLARVTYLLAIGTERLAAKDRPQISIPIYLGDSLQWEQQRDLFHSEDKVSVSTSSDELTGAGGGSLLNDDLEFPRSVLTDAGAFDRLVADMADKSLDSTNSLDRTLVTPILNRHKVADPDRPMLTNTFSVMRGLAKTGRDHIWGYYVRNLIRPIWLSEPQNRVDVLVGNPPWLRYSKMTADMQDRYKKLAKPRNLLTGGLGGSGRDLSTLFVVRAIEMYAKPEATFAFVMPHGTLTRLPHTGFRSGRWSPHSAQTGHLEVAFGIPWDLTRAPTGFPMVSCVIVGKRTSDSSSGLTSDVVRWIASFSDPNQTWPAVEAHFSVEPGTVKALSSEADAPVSPYKKRFRQGAIIVPRVLFAVEEASAGPLGAGAGRKRVRSRRTTAEKKPWKDVASLEASVEAEFVRPVYLGAKVVPYRLMAPIHAILPVTPAALMSRAEIANHAGLDDWWTQAEMRWESHRVKGDTSTLLDRLDFHGQLSAQLPVSTHRVVYTSSGTTLAAARMLDERALIEHQLYWGRAENAEEALYLVGILNSRTLLDRVTPLQALGLFGPRHFDKNVFRIPFPTYDPSDPTHTCLVDLVRRAEEQVAIVTLSPNFKKARADVRQDLDTTGLAQEIEEAVDKILPTIA